MRSLDETDLLEFQLERADHISRAREGLLNFTTFTKPNYETNWHHRLTCKYLNAFAQGKIKRLMIFQPPRHGKSELVSRRLPAFLFGKDPRTTIISTSYGAELASKMNRDVQRIIDSPLYREIFPGVELPGENAFKSPGKWVRNSTEFEIVPQEGHIGGGTYRCAGVGGAITGMGGQWIIIDDPIKNQEEADSPVYREKLWDWYSTTLHTRLEKDASILLTVTRWHEDDLAGRLLVKAKQEEEADQWVVLNLPAIAESKGKNKYDPREEGEALWPEKYPIKVLKAKRAQGVRAFNSLYQQRPAAPEGSIIKRSWLKFYSVLPARFDEEIQSWDCAFKDKKTSDYVVGHVWGRKGADKYLVAEIRDQMNLPTTIQSVRALSARYPRTHTKLIEDKANGPAVIQMLQSEISGLIAVEPQGDKVARLNAASPDFEAGNIYLPDPSIAPWILDYIEELVSFPAGKYDDRVDATSQAINRLRASGNAVFTKEHIPSKIKSITSSVRSAEAW